MKKNIERLLVFVICAFSYAASAQVFQNVEVRGLGCPEGSSSVVVSPDGKSLSILFNDFKVEVPNLLSSDNSEAVALGLITPAMAKNGTADINICNISFILELPADFLNHQLEVGLDYRGHVFMEQGLRSMFRSMLFQNVIDPNTPVSRPIRSIVENQSWLSAQSELDQDLIINTKKIINVASGRPARVNGAKSKLNINFKNVIGLMTIRPNDPISSFGQLTIDSNDISGKMTIKFK